MTDQRDIPGGVVHDLPDDLRDALRNDPAALATWEDITPLARNAWICWVEVSEESGNADQAPRMGPGELAGRETPALLLARLFSSLTFDASGRLC